MERNELAREIENLRLRSSTIQDQVNINFSAKTFTDTGSQTTSKEPSISIPTAIISSSTNDLINQKMRDVEILKLSDEVRLVSK